MVIIMLGAQGTGKGTVAGILSEKTGWPQISTGDIFRKNISEKTELGVEANKYIAAGNLVPDEITVPMVISRLSEEDAKRNKYEEEYKAYLSSKFILYGLTIKELSFDKSEPHITFDNTKEAKNVIDNLMLNLYQNAKDIPNLGFDLTKLWTTGEEFFTVSLASGQPLNNNLIMDNQ